MAYKTFKIVVVSFVLDLGTNFPTSNTTVMNISNNRPRSSVFAVGNAYIDTASKPCIVTVTSGGAIMVQGFSGRYLAFCVTYLTY